MILIGRGCAEGVPDPGAREGTVSLWSSGDGPWHGDGAREGACGLVLGMAGGEEETLTCRRMPFGAGQSLPASSLAGHLYIVVISIDP